MLKYENYEERINKVKDFFSEEQIEVIKNCIEESNENPENIKIYENEINFFISCAEERERRSHPEYLEQLKKEAEERRLERIEAEKRALERSKQMFPEYFNEDGYFNSEEFLKIYEEIDNSLPRPGNLLERAAHGGAGSPSAHWKRIKMILKIKYNIDWLTPDEINKALGILIKYD